ncbi:hypothetical protein E2C01_008711 [Portunus trituberculatus]|uniref:Uncharacterized protein n=1 Tax=Portunus trituberculatus TaxID=210409 RepID=A0A5B7D507_PORTR|nr:hypothetical protein [Portunus trituberculatus]
MVSCSPGASEAVSAAPQGRVTSAAPQKFSGVAIAVVVVLQITINNTTNASKVNSSSNNSNNKITRSTQRSSTHMAISEIIEHICSTSVYSRAMRCIIRFDKTFLRDTPGILSGIWRASEEPCQVAVLKKLLPGQNTHSDSNLLCTQVSNH